MILGIGSDLVDIRRIEALQTRFGGRFAERWFTAQERKYCTARTPRAVAAYFAKRFAGKEAFAKAIGTGFGTQASWQDVEILRVPSARPTIQVSGKAAERLRESTPEGRAAFIHVTLSDEYPMAFAQVIIELRWIASTA